MKTTQKIYEFLTSVSKITIGLFELGFSNPSRLDQDQIGYCKNALTGESLITGKEGDWKEEWLVIGWDGMVGDPIFLDLQSQELTVFSAPHGVGYWEPSKIADSLESFSQIIIKLRELSNDREDLVRLENKPISFQEGKDFLDFVRQNNPESDPEFWEAIIQVCSAD